MESQAQQQTALQTQVPEKAPQQAAPKAKSAYAQKPDAPKVTAKRPAIRAYSVDFSFFTDPETFMGDLFTPESIAANTFACILNTASLNKQQKLVASCGNSLIAAGLAVTMAQQDEKVCLLELGQDGSLAVPLFGLDTEIGVSNLFNNSVELDNLIIMAKGQRLIPNLYVLPQGSAEFDWRQNAGAAIALIRALSKKFNRIILSLPNPTTQRQSIFLQQLQPHYLSVFNDGQINQASVAQLQQQLAHTPIQVFQ